MKKTAVFSMARDEDVYLPIWLKYYSTHFSDEDIWIVDHNTNNGSTSNLSCNVIHLFDHPSICHTWKTNVCGEYLSFLLTKYEVVLYADIDEIIYHPSGIGNYMSTIEGRITIKCNGYHVFHNINEEPDLELDKPILQQRRYWSKSLNCLPESFDKPTLSTVPLYWQPGHHSASSDYPIVDNSDLLLIHLHYMDYKICNQRHHHWLNFKWDSDLGSHSKDIDDKLKASFLEQEVQLIPEEIRSKILC